MATRRKMTSARKTQTPWWRIDDEEQLAGAVVSQFRYLDQKQQHHRQRNLDHLRSYSNRMAATMSGRSFADYDPWSIDRLRYNLVQAVVDAAVAQAAANRTRPFPLTVGGDNGLKRQAKRMQAYFDGQFYREKIYELANLEFQNGCIFGTGLMKVFPCESRVRYERILADNWIVDDVEGQNGPDCVRNFMEYREVDKESAADEWEDHAEAIRAADVLRSDQWGRHGLSEPVGLVEAWHCPSEDGEEGGRHVIVCEGAVILDEPYMYAKPPVAAFRWKVPPIGYYGTGLAEELTPLQISIEHYLMRIDRALWQATAQLWFKKGTIAQSSLSNDDRVAREYDEAPPVHVPVNVGIAEWYAHIDKTVARGFELAGISQLQAMAQKPAGVNSGEAQRVYNDTASARFQHVMKRFEQFHLDIAELSLRAEKQIAENGGERVLLGKGRRGLEELRFQDIDLDRDRYILQVFPTSLLPTQPQGKIQTIKELSEIRPDLVDTLLAQTEMPDLESALARINGPYELTELLIERMLDYGEYRPPEPGWPLDQMAAQIDRARLQAEVENAPRERIELLINFLEQIEALKMDAAQQAAAAAPQPAPMMPGPMPPGMPAPGMPPIATQPQLPPGMPPGL